MELLPETERWDLLIKVNASWPSHVESVYTSKTGIFINTKDTWFAAPSQEGRYIAVVA